MKIKVICETYIDIPILEPDFWNSDTEEEYREDIKAELMNRSMDYIWNKPMRDISEDCKIISVEPYEDGIDDVEKLVDKWKHHYNKR
jgi:hypothetical protein